MGDVMTGPLEPKDATPAGDRLPARGILHRPVVMAGLLLYFLALGGAAVLLSQAKPGLLPKAAFPPYEVNPAWVDAVFPQIRRESPKFAETRFRDRVDELRWRAELYERQRCWKRAKSCYDEIAVLIRAESHPVTRYIRERTRMLAALEEP